MATREEIRTLIREEVRDQLEDLRKEVSAHTASISSSARAMERLTLLTVGDEELKVPGLLNDVEALKQARQASTLERTRLVGIWIGGSTVALLVLRAAWYAFDKLIATP